VLNQDPQRRGRVQRKKPFGIAPRACDFAGENAGLPAGVAAHTVEAVAILPCFTFLANLFRWSTQR
jgi:hypothetical protein